MTRPLIAGLQAEILKCRHTAALWLTLIGSAFIPAVNVLKCVARPEFFAPKMKDDPWGAWMEHNWQIAAAFLLVMYVILVVSMIVQIEYRNNTWKQVYASPRSYADIFISKFIIIQLMVVACFIFFQVFMILS